MSEDVADLDEDFDPMESMVGPLRSTVIDEVRKALARQDASIGMFRDFADGSAGRALHGPTVSRDMDAEREARRKRLDAERTGRITWRHLLDEAHASVVSSGPEPRIRAQLVELAALAVSWIEAIDRRKDEKRIELKRRPTWWARLKAWFRS